MSNTQDIPVVILKTKTGYSVHSPIVHGCVATGKTLDSTIKRIKSAPEFHLEGEKLVKNKTKASLRILKDALAEFGTEASYVTVEIAA